MKKILEKTDILSQYNYIIINKPPTLNLLIINILYTYNKIIIPFRPNKFSKKKLNNFYKILKQIKNIKITKIPKILTHIPNLINLKQKQKNEDLAKITQNLKNEFGQRNIIKPFLNKTPLVKSQAQRKSVFDYQSKEFTPLQNQFNELANLISKNNS